MAKFVAADVILNATTVRQCTNVSHRTGQEHRKAMVSGGAVISQISGKKAEEVTSVTSYDIGVLAALGTNTFCSDGTYLTGSTITVPWKSRAAGGTFASGSAHCALAGSTALVIPTSFEASQDGDGASCNFEIHWVSADGITVGATGSTGNALGSQAFSAEFALGPAYINGTEIVGVQSIKVTPGITLVKVSDKGLVWPTHISIQSVMPTIEIVTNDIDAVAATINVFTAMTSANVYFRKRADSGIYSASSDNVRFTFAAGLSDTNAVEVSDTGNGSSTITLHGKTLTSSSAVALP